MGVLCSFMSSALLSWSFVSLPARPKVLLFGLVPGLCLTVGAITRVGVEDKSAFPDDFAVVRMSLASAIELGLRQLLGIVDQVTKFHHRFF